VRTFVVRVQLDDGMEREYLWPGDTAQQANDAWADAVLFSRAGCVVTLINEFGDILATWNHGDFP
jgi:hypothetical protein